MNEINNVELGSTFGRWTVIGFEFRRGRRTYCACRCECGTIRNVLKQNLLNGRSQSCGCFNREQAAIRMAKEVYVYAPTEKRLYKIWRGMKWRCSPSYKRKCYYNKGIRVCSEWRNSFDEFRQWALANGYRDDLSIDRIDGNKDYEPKNCRWVTLVEQRRNQSNNRWITFNGETMLITDWAKRLNVSRSTIRNRLMKNLPLIKTSS